MLELTSDNLRAAHNLINSEELAKLVEAAALRVNTAYNPNDYAPPIIGEVNYDTDLHTWTVRITRNISAVPNWHRPTEDITLLHSDVFNANAHKQKLQATVQARDDQRQKNEAAIESGIQRDIQNSISTIFGYQRRYGVRVAPMIADATQREELKYARPPETTE